MFLVTIPSGSLHCIPVKNRVVIKAYINLEHIESTECLGGNNGLSMAIHHVGLVYLALGRRNLVGMATQLNPRLH